MRYLALFAAGIAFGQTDPPLTVKEKGLVHLKNALGPQSLGMDVVQGAVLHWADAPTEWGQGWGPFGYRVGARTAGDMTRNFMQFGVNSALKHDPRYVRLEHGTVKQRIGNAFRQMLVVRGDDGEWKPAVARWSSAAGISVVSRYWLPERLRGVEPTMTRMGYALAGDVAFNAANEFVPIILKKIFKTRYSPPSSPSINRKTGSKP